MKWPTVGQSISAGLLFVLTFWGAATITRCVEAGVSPSPAPIRTWHLSRSVPRGQMDVPDIGEIIGAADEHLRILLDNGSTVIDCACVIFASTPEDSRVQQHCACTAPAPTPTLTTKGPLP